MNKIKIFLSGSVMKSFSDLNVEKKYWEEDEEEKLSNGLCFNVELLNPNLITLSKSDREGRFEADLKMLLDSDMVLVDGIGKKGIGVGAEMALAKNWKIPVYTIAPNESHYRKKNDAGEEWIHPFIYELSDKIFENINDFIEYMNELYRNGNIPRNGIMDTSQVLDKYNSFDGGYDEGYCQVSEFWGTNPAELIVKCATLLKNSDLKAEVKCLDLGCGHGKNAIFLSKQGFDVEAWDASYYAIYEARQQNKSVNWKVRDIKKIYDMPNKFHLVIMTGCLHCLASASDIERVVRTAQEITLPGGYHVIAAFNSSEQNLAGHSPEFHPFLLSHQDYLKLYDGWKVIETSNITQEDIHKHNGIKHYHSITRILAQKL